MRLLLLVLNIIIGVSLATHIPEAEAAASSKIIKKRTSSRNKASSSAIDVWERIRSGMKIPSPTAALAQEPANDVRIRSGASTAAMKLHKQPDGMANTAKVSLNAPEQASAPVQRYTELGRSKLGQRNYTELGWKLLGANTSSTVGNDCTPSLSTREQKESTPEGKYKIALLKLKDQMKILRNQTKTGDAQSRFHLRTAGKEFREPAGTIDLSRGSTLSAKARRTGHPLKTATPASPCDESQLAVNQRKLKGHLLEKKNGLAGHSGKQAVIDDRIDKYIAAYSQNPDFLYRVAQRAHPYLYHIVEELSKYQLPLELALLPIVESAYQPTAQSPKSAKGLWQFIPSTGKDYNLIQSHDYDERLDIPKSTQAAIRFLSGLNHHFNGDWLLALAAYNSGQATVDNAISQNQAEGLATDFWSLNLPEETQNYVPRLLALSKIFARPASYGIKLPSIKNEPYFVKVKIDREFDVNYLAEKEISTIAKLADLEHDQFSRLNPGYLGSTLSRKRSYAFLMPFDNANQLRQRLASIAQFMSEPALPLKSVVQKEKADAYLGSYDPSLSLVSELVLNKPSDVTKFATPFISLNVDDAPGPADRMRSPMA